MTASNPLSTFYNSAGDASITNSTVSTGTTTGALVVAGGVGIGGKLYVGGGIDGAISTATNLAGGTAGQVPYQTNVGTTGFTGPGTSGQVLLSAGGGAPTFTNTSSIHVNTANFAVNDTGGAAGSLRYQTGINASTFLGIGTAGQVLLVNPGATAPVWTSTASIHVGNANFAVTAGSASGGAGSSALIAVTNNQASTTPFYLAAVTTSSGNQAINVVAGWGPFVVPLSGQVVVNTNTNATSTSTGALVVRGGLAVGHDIVSQGTYTGLAATIGSIKIGRTAAGTIDTVSGNLTIDSAGGQTTINDNVVISGNLTVQGSTTIVDSTVTNVADPIITLGGGAADAAPIADDNKDRGIAFKWHNGTSARTGFFGFDDSTGYFTFLTSATFTNEVVAAAGGTTKGAVDVNLAGGSAMAIHYQSAADTTAFLAAGTSGYVLRTNGSGSVPTWVDPSTLASSSATSVTVTADNAQTTPGYLLHVNTGSGTLSAETTPAWGPFIIPSTGQLVINTTTNASSTITGALRVVGGASIGGPLYASSIETVQHGSAATSSIALKVGNGNYSLNFLARVAAGNYNPAVLTDDSLLYFTNGNQGFGGLVIAPWSSTATGIRISNTGSISIPAVLNAVSTLTGALQIAGGVGVGRDIWVGGDLRINGASRLVGVTTVTNVTNASNTASGAFQVAGGAGFGRDVFIGGNLTVTGSINATLTGTVTTATTVSVTNNNSAATPYYLTAVTTSSGNQSITVNGGWGPFFIPSTGQVVVNTSTNASSTITGALLVIGGAGIGRNLYVGGSLFISTGTGFQGQVLATSIQEFTATASQTTFAISGGYTVGMIQVYVNGLHFGAADYTASNGSTVVLNQARNTGDLVRIVCSQGFAASAMQAYNFTEVTASSNGQTAFAAIYNTATVQVFVDGVLRSPTAYTASNGTSITLSSGVGIVIGTKVGVISFNSISLTNAISSSGGTINGNLNVNGSLQQGGVDVKAYATAVALALGA